MAKTELITTLHKGANTDIDVFPNIKKENIPSASIDESKVDPALLQKITPVVANPTIVGSEADLTSIQVGDTKYKVTGGGGGEVAVRDYAADEWSQKTWTGLTSFYGNYVWTDGDNIYYSFESTQYVLDKSTSTWSQKTWTGLASFYGNNIWTDGENIYYSFWSDHYVLNKSTSTWSVKTWSGLTSFRGIGIWTDGEKVYYSIGSDQYVLNKSTSTWSTKRWTGLTNFEGSNVWTDGENIYYSNGSLKQYVLNKISSIWIKKEWVNLTSFNGQYIWTDGEDVYYSSPYSSQCVLDKTTSTWIEKEWPNLTSFDGQYIWTIGEDIYYSKSATQYTLNNSATHPATVLAKVAETGDYNDLKNTPPEMNITSQEIDEYFEACDVSASVTTEGNNVVLNLTNADIVTENGEPVLTTEVPNVSVQNNILGIE